METHKKLMETEIMNESMRLSLPGVSLYYVLWTSQVSDKSCTIITISVRDGAQAKYLEIFGISDRRK